MVINKLTAEQKAAFDELEDPDFPVWKPDLIKDAEPFELPPGTQVKSWSEIQAPLSLAGSLQPVNDTLTRQCAPLGLDYLKMNVRRTLDETLSPLPSPPPPPPPQQQQHEQEQGGLDDMIGIARETGTEVETEILILPETNDVRVVKKLLERVVKERSFSRPDAVDSDDEYEVECCGAVGRDSRNRVVLCLKWKGYPWSEATWETLRMVSKQVKDDLVAVWGPIASIKANSQPLINDNYNNEEDSDSMSTYQPPPVKRTRRA